ncbi:MAG: four helix bundle protein [Cyclobacteriaceae bacterium]|nr:four helix bundle protein [Cyclobacteriaceae bacterium]UYN87648.1 MAG: four helix bundle protein [Cyclobacteriaceae bacterium]
MKKKEYIPLQNLEVYQLARELAKKAWVIYDKMSWQEKKIIGDQFISSIDSIGANIAEGYGRFHYLDRVRFLYNARGSMLEAINHWLELLVERNKISQPEFDEMKFLADKLSIKLNNFIRSIYESKNNKEDE